MPGLLSHATETPDRPAFILADAGFTETYSELEERSRLIALALRDCGLERGDCVAMLIGNAPYFFDFYWATQRIGLYLTALNWHAEPSELSYIIENCDANALVVDAALSDLAELLVSSDAPKVHTYLSIGGALDGFQSLDAQRDAFAKNAILERQSAGSVMIYSSGTTGRPKGVRRPLPEKDFDNEAYINATTHVMRTFGLNGDDRYLCPAPLYHSAPIRSCSAMQQLGATVIAMEKFDPETTLSTIENHKVTAGQFVPTHFKRLLSLPNKNREEYETSSLRVVVHAAAPCPRDIKRQMIEWWGPIILEYYAGTEGGGVMIDTKDWLERPGSVGKPWQGLDVAIMNESEEMVCTPCFEGPIYFKNDPGAVPNFSYYKDPEKTSGAYRGEWFTLGDIGYLDEDGFLFLTDRQSNLIISGGVNIYPQEVENLLASRDDVFDVAVIGEPDPDLGEVAKAIVVLNEKASAGSKKAAELIDYTQQHFSKMKCPRRIEFTDALPRTETGKLLKRKLKP